MATFKVWILANHLESNSPIGDLARDIKGDLGFSSRAGKSDKKDIRFYLESRGACYECLEAFEEAWAEYIS